MCPDADPGISVIMLTYNREKLVSGMIGDILGQSFPDYEFVIVDNGSTDYSGRIADEYARKDDRIHVIHRERGNIGSGRNAGLDAARGEYVAFVDDDDRCTPDYLGFLYQLAAGSQADISICGATWADFDEKKLMTAEEAVETLLWRKRYNVAFPTKLIRRKLFEGTRFPETGKYDDIYLMPYMLAKAERVAYHGLSQYHFSRHGGNNSAWTQDHRLLDAETLREYLRVYGERTRWLVWRFPEKADLWRYFNWSFMLSMVEKINRFQLADCEGLCKEMLGELRRNRDAFCNSCYMQDFERKWAERYVIVDICIDRDADTHGRKEEL